MYMRNRYYNPQTGTFTQPDPIGLAGGLNVYGFAAGDSISYSDPMGLCHATITNRIVRLSFGPNVTTTVNNSTSRVGRALYTLMQFLAASQDDSDGRTLWTVLGEAASSRHLLTAAELIRFVEE
jgi:uncharacterized protein RhaS with RHS repeats